MDRYNGNYRTLTARKLSMPHKRFNFQPGAILHQAIAGALKAQGSGFELWCHENGINPSTARNCTYGQSKGERGQAMIDRMVADAGPEMVKALYVHRLRKHLSECEKALGAEKGRPRMTHPLTVKIVGVHYAVFRGKKRVSQRFTRHAAADARRLEMAEADARAGRSKRRPCMTCKKPFLSEGPHHRMCGRCRAHGPAGLGAEMLSPVATPEA